MFVLMVNSDFTFVKDKREKEEKLIEERHAQPLSTVWLFPVPWTVACQAPLSVGSSGKNTGAIFSSRESGQDDPGIEPVSLASPTLAGRLFTTSTT